MKKNLLLLILSITFIQYASSQTKPVPTAVENKMTDVLCNCVGKIDLAKISNKSEATAAYIDCIGQNMDILTQLAAERNMQITDVPAMEKLGVVIAENLMKANCASFMKLSVLTVEKKNNEGTGTTEGKLKRIDLKGFNYLVITDKNGSEKSFIWLRQFPQSEKFENGLGQHIGKTVNIKWQEIEVYLPQAKGYYKVKEITKIDF